jgi:biofilm PGA synthesis N-glycosyltransferase PgaC
VLTDLTLAIASFVFIYPFIVYPLLLRLISGRLARRTPAPASFEPLPHVAMVICALNEEGILRAKLLNCLALEYPKVKLRIIVISDGSTDATAAIAREFADQGIELIERTSRRGKVRNLNETLPTLREEIFVLSDANVLYRSDAVLRLVERFRDPSVGCVSGKVILTNAPGVFEKPTQEYYSQEWFLQRTASALYSMAGADGAMYAIRRELFRPCPDDTIVEDFVIPMAVVRQGKRVVFEAAAIGWEDGATNIREEFSRKVRIAAGAAQGLLRGNVWPGRAPLSFWFVFASHKLLRWLSPMVVLFILAIASISASRPLPRLVLTGFSLIAVTVPLRIMTGVRLRLVDVPFYILFTQIAVGYGLLKGFLGIQSVLWAKANR